MTMRNLIILLLIALFSGSCVVSKKKYEDMQKRKDRKISKLNSALTEKKGEISRLNETLEQTRSDYNDMKNDLFESNAQKSSAIDSLNMAIRGLANDKSALSQELQKAIDLYEEEKEKMMKLSDDLEIRSQRTNELSKDLEEKKKRLAELEQMIENNKQQVNALKKTVSDALVSFEGTDLSVFQKNGKVYVSLEEKLLFKSGSTKIDAKGVSALKKLAVVLEQNPDIDVNIEGHTDTVGKAKFNWDLSVKRATAIVDIIQKNSKIDAARLTASGRGMYVPIDKGKSKEALAKNRRTEIILTPKLDKLYQILDEDQSSF